MTIHIEEIDFLGIDFTKEDLEVGSYEKCLFKDCNFNEAALSYIIFEDCEFVGCDLSNAKIDSAQFRGVAFKDCRMIGLSFEAINDLMFGVRFENCQMMLASFYKRKLAETPFKSCNLQEVDFAECKLNEAVFDQCDLLGAKFEGTDLTKADFRSSWNYTIDPEINRMHKARFSMEGILGLLRKYDIDVEEWGVSRR